MRTRRGVRALITTPFRRFDFIIQKPRRISAGPRAREKAIAAFPPPFCPVGTFTRIACVIPIARNVVLFALFEQRGTRARAAPRPRARPDARSRTQHPTAAARLPERRDHVPRPRRRGRRGAPRAAIARRRPARDRPPFGRLLHGGASQVRAGGPPRGARGGRPPRAGRLERRRRRQERRHHHHRGRVPDRVQVGGRRHLGGARQPPSDAPRARGSRVERRARRARPRARVVRARARRAQARRVRGLGARAHAAVPGARARCVPGAPPARSAHQRLLRRRVQRALERAAGYRRRAVPGGPPPPLVHGLHRVRDPDPRVLRLRGAPRAVLARRAPEHAGGGRVAGPHGAAGRHRAVPGPADAHLARPGPRLRHRGLLRGGPPSGLRRDAAPRRGRRARARHPRHPGRRLQPHRPRPLRGPGRARQWPQLALLGLVLRQRGRERRALEGLGGPRWASRAEPRKPRGARALEGLRPVLALPGGRRHRRLAPGRRARGVA